MRKHGGTPSRRDKHVTLAAISPPGEARGRFVGGQQSGLAGCKPPPLFTREASSCSSQGRRQGEPWGASPRPSAPTYLPQGGRRGGANCQPDKDNENTDKNGGNPNPNPGGNSEPSGGQSGPTTRSQPQAQQEQGPKREHEGGDDSNAKKRSRFMRMARKLQNKGFEVTCPAEF